MTASENIRVSLCVIALNEQENIGDLFADITKQTYDHAKTEIVLVDSGSEDDTRKMMSEFKRDSDFASVKILDNPLKIQAGGWNTAITNASGELIIRVDAHARIPEDFVQENVNCIDSGEDVCGGRRINVIKGDSVGKKILLMAENSMFGSGVAAYRNSDKKQYVKTVAHACYKQEVFRKCGLFNTGLLRSEDNEMHYRIRKNGYKICMSDKIHSRYLTRASLKGMLKQKWGNGKWIGITAVRKTPATASGAVPAWGCDLLLGGLTFDKKYEIALADKIDMIFIDADVMGKVSGSRSYRSAIYEWLEAGGFINLKYVSLNWKPLAMVGRGSLHFNEKLEPNLHLDTSSKGLLESMDSMLQYQWLESKGVFVSKILLGNKAFKLSPKDKYLTVTAPIDFKDRKFQIENITVAKF